MGSEDRKAALLRMERERREQFRALIDRVPSDRMEEPTLNADGWSVKDLLWHMGCWDLVVARELEKIREGTFVNFDWNTEENNARFLAEGRRKDPESVRDETDASHARCLRALTALDEATPKVEELFSESAYKHVDDHLPELRRFVEMEGGSASLD